MDAILLLVVAAIPCLGLWAVITAKNKILRILGALFCGLAVGLAAGVIVGMSRAWSGGNGNAAFFGAAAFSLVVLLPFALRNTAVQLKEEPIQSPQRNAGSRPSSGDSSASETPSSLGPRG